MFLITLTSTLPSSLSKESTPLFKDEEVINISPRGESFNSLLIFRPICWSRERSYLNYKEATAWHNPCIHVTPTRQKSDALDLLSRSVRAALAAGGEIWKCYFYTGPMLCEGAWPRGMEEMVAAEQEAREET